MVCGSVTVQRSVACGGSFQAPGEPLSHLGHQGSTPLYVAAERGHREVVQQLMAAGPLAVDWKTSRPKVERGSQCHAFWTAKG